MRPGLTLRGLVVVMRVEEEGLKGKLKRMNEPVGLSGQLPRIRQRGRVVMGLEWWGC